MSRLLQHPLIRRNAGFGRRLTGQSVSRRFSALLWLNSVLANFVTHLQHGSLISLHVCQALQEALFPGYVMGHFLSPSIY